MSRRLALHPYLFAAYPALYLYSRNVLETRPFYPLVCLAICLATTAALDFVFRRLMKDRERAAVALTCFVVLFFMYGQVVHAMYDRQLGGLALGHGRVLLPLFSAAYGLALLVVVRAPRLREIGDALTAVGLVLLLMCGAKTTEGLIKIQRARAAPPVQSGAVAANRPDIYYLMLDMYAGSSSLSEQLNFDNHEFLDGLRRRGFRVAAKSRSNYTQTFLSLSSTLNMRYLDDVPAEMHRLGLSSVDQTIPYRMIYFNPVVAQLKKWGYHYVHFDSGWGATQRNMNADRLVTTTNWEFYQAMLEMTPLIHVPFFETRDADARRRRILDAFSQLADAPTSSPKFVFAHMIIPHPAYVFERDGRPTPEEMTRRELPLEMQRHGYKGQLEFLNGKVLAFLDVLLSRPGPKPIILIHGDHGTTFTGRVQGGWLPTPLFCREHFPVLNALYAPAAISENFYDTISPVNDFRVILAGIEGRRPELLPDTSFFSNLERPYDFVPLAPEIFNTRPGMFQPTPQRDSPETLPTTADRDD